MAAIQAGGRGPVDELLCPGDWQKNHVLHSFCAVGNDITAFMG